MDLVSELKELAAQAKTTDKNFEVFGSKSHRYNFGLPVPIERIHGFENEYNITLPEPYVTFLTEVGNGGAGPDYGLYSIDALTNHNDHLKHINTEETFIGKSMTVEKWNNAMKILEQGDDEYDKVTGVIAKNALVIGTQGCTLDNVLMCGGSEYGKIVYLDWNLDTNNPPILTGLTFEEWLLGYFRRILEH